MKYIFYTIVFAVLLTSCGVRDTKETQPEPVAAADDFAARTAAFEQRKQEMLEIADRTGNFIFSDDTELEALDPHAFWLMNRMMQMNLLIETADDTWAWVLAMNDSVEEYNRRLGRKIGSVDAAVLAIGELIDIYNAGNQPELNVASYVLAILAYYKAGYKYWQLIDGMNGYADENDEDIRLRNLCYREFSEWFDLLRAATEILYSYTYAAARYSALPMDINGLFERWALSRAEELDIEYKMCWSPDRSPCENDARSVSPLKYDNLIAYFKGRSQQDIVEEVAADLGDSGFAQEYTDGRYDIDEMAETMHSYETALRNWRTVREQISNTLKDRAQQRTYRELTKRVLARLYNDLKELKKIQC